MLNSFSNPREKDLLLQKVFLFIYCWRRIEVFCGWHFLLVIKQDVWKLELYSQMDFICSVVDQWKVLRFYFHLRSLQEVNNSRNWITRIDKGKSRPLCFILQHLLLQRISVILYENNCWRGYYKNFAWFKYWY